MGLLSYILARGNLPRAAEKGTKTGFGAHTALSPKPAIPSQEEDISKIPGCI